MNQVVHNSANDREARDLAAGAFALKVVVGANVLSILAAIVFSATPFKATPMRRLLG